MVQESVGENILVETMPMKGDPFFVSDRFDDALGVDFVVSR